MGVLEVWKGAETEYVLNALQFILLMELADAENIYSWPLPEEEDLTDEDYILAMHDLIRRSLVDVTEDGEPVYSLSPTAQILFGDVFHAVSVLECVSALEGSLPCLIYRGTASYTVTQWDLEDGYICVCRIDPDGLGTWLEEAGFLPGHPFETEREGTKALRYDEQTQASLSKIRESIVCTPEVPAALWALQEDVRSVLRTAAGPEGRPGGMAVFFETDTESWILTCLAGDGERSTARGDEETGSAGEKTGSGSHQQVSGNEDWEIVPDSREKREKIWRELI